MLKKTLKATADNRQVNDDGNVQLRVVLTGSSVENRIGLKQEIVDTLCLTPEQYTSISFGMSWSSSLELFLHLTPEQEVMMRLKYSEMFGDQK